MKKVQSGVIQTILENNGKLSHYRLNLHVPKQYAELVGYENISILKGNKYMYCPISTNYEELMGRMTSAQVTICDMKLIALNERREQLYSRLINNQQ